MSTLATTSTITTSAALAPDQVANLTFFRFVAGIHTWLYSAFVEVFSKLSSGPGYCSRSKNNSAVRQEINLFRLYPVAAKKIQFSAQKLSSTIKEPRTRKNVERTNTMKSLFNVSVSSNRLLLKNFLEKHLSQYGTYVVYLNGATMSTKQIAARLKALDDLIWAEMRAPVKNDAAKVLACSNVEKMSPDSRDAINDVIKTSRSTGITILLSCKETALMPATNCALLLHLDDAPAAAGEPMFFKLQREYNESQAPLTSSHSILTDSTETE